MITSASDNSGGASGPSVWRLCSVQQVEDLKSLLGVFPLRSSGIMVSVSIGVMLGMIMLQALAMDRSLGPQFNIPAGAISVCSRRVHRGNPGPGPRRLPSLAQDHQHPSVPAAARGTRPCGERCRLGHRRAGGTPEAWRHARAPRRHAHVRVMVPALAGHRRVGEALHFPGNMAFYYMEFPRTLRSLATAMAPLLIAMGFYLSTVFMDVVRRVTVWLPGNIDQGRLDNVYWTLAVAATLNFGYFLVCVWRYKYHNRGTRVTM